MPASISTLGAVPGLSQLMDDADHIDMKSFIGTKSLPEFVAAMVNYRPGWLSALYRVRAVVARLLGLEHHAPASKDISPNNLTFTPGEQVTIFTTLAGDPQKYWIAEASDKHLSGYIGVVRESTNDGQFEFHTFTIVHYKHWTGPLYFNCIRPFHHLIVHCMGKAAVR